jgi:hypothetical protein
VLFNYLLLISCTFFGCRHQLRVTTLKMDQNMLEINSVQYILQNSHIPYEVKVLIKQKGRPTPDVEIKFSSSKSRTYNRVFNQNIYNKHEWMCGCPVINKLFCFVCLLLKKNASAWTKGGVDDLKHMAERAKKHDGSVDHLSACMDFSVLGKQIFALNWTMHTYEMK